MMLSEKNHKQSHRRGGNKQVGYLDNAAKLKPFKRSVSIVGVGVTPFRLLKDDPRLKHLTEPELFGYAAVEAMRDAGITGKDVEFFIHGQAGPGTSNFTTPNIHVANWFGVKGKGSFSHSEACATGYIALELAANMVASGTYDVVLSGGVETCSTLPFPTKVLCNRERTLTEAGFHELLCSTMDRCYNQFTKGILPTHFESWLTAYKEDNHLSKEDVDRVLTRMAINSRYMASINPLSINHQNYTDRAHEMGFDTAEEFLHSKYNPLMGQFMRAANMEERCDGSGAFVVMPTEMAYKYTDHPIEIVAVGHALVEYSNPMNERRGTEIAYQQVKEFTGLTGADMDIFMTNDFHQPQQLLSAECCEYLPKGEGWKYMLEDRCMFTGDRPVQTNGGRCHYGHAAAASGTHDIYEVCMQMRGEAEAHQIQKPVKYGMLRGFGGGQNLLCIVLKYL